MMTMAGDEHSSIQTRPSLLNRLKTGDDTESWQEFYRVYGKLVRDFAVQAGLTDTEADEVVQETTIAVARRLSEFRYDPKVCRFKTWLLNQTSWRIKDQLLRRHPGNWRLTGARRPSSNRSSCRSDGAIRNASASTPCSVRTRSFTGRDRRQRCCSSASR